MRQPPRPPDPQSSPEDPDRPATESERLAAAALRCALDSGTEDASAPSTADDEVRFALGLRMAIRPTALDELAHRRIFESAIVAARAGQQARNLSPHSQRARAWRWGLAAAAAAALLVGTPTIYLSTQSGPTPKPVRPPSEMILSRSSEQLFVAPFVREGGTSARVDMIVASRDRELRANRFTRWGTR